jgi:plastocyanin
MSTLTRRELLARASALLAGLPLLSACDGMYGQPVAAQGATAASQVTIRGMAFDPPAITVPAGTTLTFVNDDSTTHTVTADDGSFDIDDVTPGRSVQLTLSTSGVVSYHCEIHPMMMGTITVTSERESDGATREPSRSQSSPSRRHQY